MAEDMESVLNMSLDEYIANFKNEKEMAAKRNNNESKFKAERRNQSYDNDDEEFDDEDSRGFWKGPSASTNFLDLDCMQEECKTLLNDMDSKNQQTPGKNQENSNMHLHNYKSNFDLRDKISGSPVPNSNSQQWRLMKPNVMTQRPAGMPPLIPHDLMQEVIQRPRNRKWGNNNNHNNNKHNNNNNKHNNNNNNKHNNNNNKHINNNNNNNYNNNPRNRWANQRNYQPYGNGSGRVQRKNNNQEVLSKSLKAVIERLNISNGHTLPQNVSVETPSSLINLGSNPYPRNSSMFAQTAAPVNLQPAAQNLFNKANDNLSALLAINDSNTLTKETMPMLATKFLDFLQNGGQIMHKPMYDMKIQKEIHDMQDKPLMYKCPGGEVVSSDGSGINNCKIIPRTSGISFNNRFA